MTSTKSIMIFACFFQQKSYKADTMLIQELRSNGFTVFWSERIYRKKLSMMFLALKKNGAMKNASKPELKHKSVQFMVMLCSRGRRQNSLTGC